MLLLDQFQVMVDVDADADVVVSVVADATSAQNKAQMCRKTGSR